MMSIIKPMCFTNLTKCFPKFPSNLLFQNPKFAFHPSFPLNIRKNNLRNLKESNIKKSVAFTKNSQQFGQIVALDPEKIEEYRADETNQPKIKKTKKKLCHISLLNNNEIEIENSKGLKGKQINKNNKDPQEEIINDNHSESKSDKIKPNYKILENNNLLNSIMPNLASRKFREKHKKILLEGKKLIKEALSSGLEAKMIFFSRKSDVEDLELSEKVKVCRTSYKELQLWSCNTTCPGIMGVFKLPEHKITNEKNSLLPVTVICDNIREPGNLGAIIRVAVGVGCKKIILTKGCVDLWDPKVLRGACGAHFKASIFSNAEWSDIKNEIPQIEEILIADNRFPLINQNENVEFVKDSDDSNEINVSCNNLPVKDYMSLDYKKFNSITYIVGGETHGISESAYEFAINRNGKRIFIPMINDMESLNSAVALGIILYETRRQMMNLSNSNTISKPSDCELAEEVVVRAS